MLHGMLFDALDGVPDELAMRADAVRGMLEARTAFLAPGGPFYASTPPRSRRSVSRVVPTGSCASR